MSFQAVQKKIEGEGYGAKAAGAILAKSTRNASPAAKKKNPALKRVMPKAQFNSDRIAKRMLDRDNDGM